MAKATTRTTRAPKGATTAPLDPTADAATLDDTLSYAMQSDADPQQVLAEIIQVVTPYCQSLASLGHLRSLLHGAAVRLNGNQDESSAPAAAFGLNDAMNIAADGSVGFASMSTILDCIASLSKTDAALAGRLAEVGSFIADGLEAMLNAQDVIEAAMEGGAA